MNECRAGSELPLPSGLMSNAQIRPLPNVGAVDPRIPSLDPRSADSIHSADCGARRRTGCGHAFRTRLWVRRGERGYTNGQVGACPNIRAVDPGVRSGNGPGLQGELGLDRGASLSSQGLVVLCHARRPRRSGRSGALVWSIGDTDVGPSPDIRARHEGVGSLNSAPHEVKLVFNAGTGIVRDGRVCLLAHRGRGGGRYARARRSGVVGTVGDAERRPGPDVVAGDECVGGFQGPRHKVVLGFDLRAIIPCGAHIGLLARRGSGGRWRTRGAGRGGCYNRGAGRGGRRTRGGGRGRCRTRGSSGRTR